VTGLQSRNRCVNVLEQYSPHGVRILDTSAANDFSASYHLFATES